MILKRFFPFIRKLLEPQNPQNKKFEKAIDYVLNTCYYMSVPSKESLKAEISLVFPIIFRASSTDILLKPYNTCLLRVIKKRSS